MKKFVIGVVLLSGCILGYNLFPSLIGLYHLKREYAYPRNGAIKLIDPRSEAPKDILIIGCSNLQYNIDCKTVQDSVPSDVDFLYFAASENSTFLQYVVDKGLTKEYRKVILYLPYSLLKKNRFLMKEPSSYQLYGCYDYAFNTIKNYLPNLFFNWSIYYEGVSANASDVKSDSLFLKKDKLIDSLRHNRTSYSTCSFPFKHNKHVVGIPHYTEDDVKFINGLRKKDQKYYFLFPPIPNLTENTASIATANVLDIGFSTVLNKPFVVDSSYFHDQWYHLNKCGSKVETEKMINAVRSIRD